jgi:hypothetical protein
MIAGAVEKNLGFVFEPAKSAGMNHAIAVALVLSAPQGRFLRMPASPAVTAELRERRERAAFDVFKFLTKTRHKVSN